MLSQAEDFHAPRASDVHELRELRKSSFYILFRTPPPPFSPLHYRAPIALYCLVASSPAPDGARTLLCGAEKSSTRPVEDALHDQQVASISQTLKSAARE